MSNFFNVASFVESRFPAGRGVTASALALALLSIAHRACGAAGFNPRSVVGLLLGLMRGRADGQWSSNSLLEFDDHWHLFALLERRANRSSRAASAALSSISAALAEGRYGDLPSRRRCRRIAAALCRQLLVDVFEAHQELAGGYVPPGFNWEAALQGAARSLDQVFLALSAHDLAASPLGYFGAHDALMRFRSSELERLVVGTLGRTGAPTVQASWRSRDVLRVAEDAYQAVDSHGCLWRQGLMVLADALEDAGCVDQGVLSELRSDGPTPPAGWWFLRELLACREW